MGNFQLSVFTTHELYNKCENDGLGGYAARDTAVDFLRQAFSKSPNHTSDVEVGSTKIPAPQEEIRSSFSARKPCTFDTAYYDNLNDWWGDYTACTSLNKSKDCDLLLTAATGSGLGGPPYACAGGGYEAAVYYATTGIKDYTDDSAGNKVDAILEEAGHCFSQDVSDLDYINYGDGTIAHDNGVLFEHGGSYYITPIGIGGDTQYNNCGQEVNKSRWNGTGWEHQYSDCEETHFTER